MGLTMSMNVNSSHFERVRTTPYISRCRESIWQAWFYVTSALLQENPYHFYKILIRIRQMHPSIPLECMYCFLLSLEMVSYCSVLRNRPNYSASNYFVTTEYVTKPNALVNSLPILSSVSILGSFSTDAIFSTLSYEDSKQETKQESYQFVELLTLDY